MPKRPDLITRKRAQIRGVIEALQQNARIVARVGGHTTADLADEVAFQEARAAMFDWAEAASEPEIRARIAQMRAELGPDGLAAKAAGVMRGLPLEIVRPIALLEILEYALGEHPAAQGA